MKLLVVVITYNRLAYTQRTLESLWRTAKLPYFLVVVDNNSSDGTQAWLKEQKKAGKIQHLVLNKTNNYPGKATNQGWAAGLKLFPEATHLLYAGNDMEFFEGWDTRGEHYFEVAPKLGLLGMDYSRNLSVPDEKSFICWPTGNDKDKPLVLPVKAKVKDVTLMVWPGNVSGCTIMPRKLYNLGIRLDETPWQSNGDKISNSQEDALLTRAVHQLGYGFGYADEKLVQTFGNPENYDDYPEYYDESYRVRGYARSYTSAFDYISVILRGQQPKHLLRFAKSIVKTASNPKQVELIVYVDKDDHSYDEVELPDEPFYHNIRFLRTKIISSSELWNQAQTQAKGPYYMLGSEDMLFKTKDWDLKVLRCFIDKPDRIAFITGSDKKNAGTIGSYGFVHQKWLETLGYFVPPGLSASQCMLWLTEVALGIARGIYVDMVIDWPAMYAGEPKEDKALYEKLAPLRQSDISKLQTYIKDYSDRVMTLARS